MLLYHDFNFIKFEHISQLNNTINFKVYGACVTED
jgi:hypothetical protein